MRDRATRRPMPNEQSILWKPLHDSHYVVASLQPSDGGRRRIFIRQRVLSHAQAMAHAAHGRRIFGLLLGDVYECSITNLSYFVIESASEQIALNDEDVAQGVEAAITQAREGKHKQVLGWYRSVANVDARPSMSVGAVHAAYFNQPWQTALVVSDTASSPGGAFFLKDSTNSRWFYAPFYELLDQAPTEGAPKTTCVAWEQYITADAVVLGATEHVTLPTQAVASAERTKTRAGVRSTLRERSEYAAGLESMDREVGSDHGVVLADVAPKPADKLAERGERRLGLIERASQTLSYGRDQRRASRSNVRLVADDEDTAAGDPPSRYIDVARAEGFFVAAKFDTQDENGNAESVWVLNEPYSGFLLTVATTSTEVVDALLHYNLRTDDVGLGRAPFPEHRDAASHTIYLRETCITSLRARCRRLRATDLLVREWKVSPAVAFISPGEWQTIALAHADDARYVVSTLNKTRIAELPDGVRTQFGIRTPGEQPDNTA